MSIPHFSPDAWRYIFNTPLECGLRCVSLLLAAYPTPCDLQRLVQYEYLLVHSGDVPQGPPSLHPASPHRSGELLVRRALIERGILFMMSRHVVCRDLSPQGIGYLAGDMALPLFDSLESPYTRTLRERAVWVGERFGSMSGESLDRFMQDNWSNWGAEFTREAFVRGGGQ
ncbi:MAG: threonine transporter [Phycisphaerales bacterium]|nr:threonine transporter [Phycisphaerales bacterium]